MTELINAFQMAQRQFDHVAELLNLDPQVAEILRWPMREFNFRIPVRMDDGTIRVFFRLPRAAQRCPRPQQGRHPLPPRRDDRYRARPGDVDDLEMRRGRHPPGRRQGRRDGRPGHPLDQRKRAPVPRLGGPDVAQHRPAPGRSRPGCRHHPADDGLDDGRILQAGRPVHPRRDHRQTGGRRRLAGPHRSHRLRRDLHRARGHEAPQDGLRPSRVAAIQGFGNVSQYAAIGFIELLGRQGGLRFLLGPRRQDSLHRQPSRRASTRAS